MKKLASNLRESARFNQQVSDSGLKQSFVIKKPNMRKASITIEVKISIILHPVSIHFIFCHFICTINFRLQRVRS
jgi:hypothetical protein